MLSFLTIFATYTGLDSFVFVVTDSTSTFQGFLYLHHTKILLEGENNGTIDFLT
jgi:hypothetical protein